MLGHEEIALKNLTAAFDTLDCEILCNKLKFYNDHTLQKKLFLVSYENHGTLCLYFSFSLASCKSATLCLIVDLAPTLEILIFSLFLSDEILFLGGLIS